VDISEVKTTIGRGSQAAEQAQATMAECADRIGEARRLTGVTQGSEHERVKLGRTRLKEAAAEARRVRDLLAAGARAAEEFRQALG
jgi:hypothetical protein